MSDTPESSSELLPCPFCGSEASEGELEDDTRVAYCANPKCLVGLPLRLWNTRPTANAELEQAYSRALQALFYSGIYDNLTAKEFREKLGIPDWWKQDIGKDALTTQQAEINRLRDGIAGLFNMLQGKSDAEIIAEMCDLYESLPQQEDSDE